jgi:hypothetical protein
VAPAYPSSQNTFVRSHEASGKLVVDFARDPKKFAVNNYVQVQPVDKVAGYYLQVTVEEAGRILDANLNNFLWYDGDPAPEGNEGLESHEWKPFACQRRSFPVRLGDLMVSQASWDILAQYGSIKARQAMTARTQLVLTAALTSGNWDATHRIDVTAVTGASGNWPQSTTARQDIKRSLETAMELILDDTLSGVEQSDMRLVISSALAMELSMTQEITDYIKGSPAALAQIKGELAGRNTMYGLPDELYGFQLHVEKTRKVTSAKGATRAVSQILPKANALLISRPGGLESVAGAPSFSTLVIFAHEEMSLETKRDDDNRRTKVRVTENLDARVLAPASGVLFSACA